jgi:hypothetical protein
MERRRPNVRLSTHTLSSGVLAFLGGVTWNGCALL